ncbi:hypothetical protein Acr_02g0009840 [Actinidia rufa]|uniref:Uncharacterized protein n=1 Tax=Actinidia rufa TaxID=165716 RepID=A0A7J0E8D5_9ERIC|nr:hypothetical protein Acr_02g0009840 [Actinidia rufa]
MEHGSPTKRSKAKGKAGVDYDASRFMRQNDKKLFNKVWVRNGAILERKLNLVALENTGISFVQNFTTRGWINLTKFKVKSVLTLCQEFMENIKHELETEQGKENLCSWVRGKKLKVTPNTFTEIFEIPQEENPEFAFPNVGMLDLEVVSQELILEGDEWDGEVQCNKIRLKDKARLLWAIGTRKTIDLPCIMFLSLCTTYKASDKRGSVPFPIDFIRIELEGPIDRASLSRSEGEEVNTRLSSLEEESGRHTVMLQDMKGMLIRIEEEDDDEEED